MRNLTVKKKKWFSRLFGLRKFWKTIKIHEILLIHEICLRMRIFAPRTQLCFMPLNEQFPCKNMFFKIFRTPNILEDHNDLWNSSNVWNLPKDVHFCATHIIVLYGLKWAIYLQKHDFQDFSYSKKFLKILKTHRILLQYEICLILHNFCDASYIILVYALEWAIYKQQNDYVFCLSKKDEQ